MRILIVDDNRDAAEALAMLLEFRGHQTHSAHDGQEAVEMASRVRPDVIVLDLGLPVMNGYEAARRIREQQDDTPPLLIALTGWGQEEHRQRTREAGFDAHVVKPVDDQVLMTTISRLVTSRAVITDSQRPD